MPERIAVLGLGAMGSAMARRLIETGYAVTVWNRSPDKAEPLVQAGATAAPSPRAAVQPGDIAITILADDRAVEEVTLGPDGFLEGMGDGVHLSMSTIAPETARRLAEAHAARGAGYVAGPVFGRPPVAAAGKLWICVSGTAGAKARVAGVLRSLSQASYGYGEDPDAANVVKLAGNFLLIAAAEAMAEAFTFAEKNGIGREQIATMFGETLFACPIYRNYGQAIATRSYEPPGFRLGLALKDIGLALATARAARTPLPFASLLHDRMLALVSAGNGDLDLAAIGLAASRDAGD